MTKDAVCEWMTATFSVSRETLEQLDQFSSMLVAENSQQNLISASTVSNLWERHIFDSAQLALHLPETLNGPMLDLGSGPGLPGLVLAILRSDQVILVESRKRRCAFLEEAITALGLSARVTVECSRLQVIAPRPAGAIVARAFAPVLELLDLAGPFSCEDTAWVLPRGKNAAMHYAELPRKHKAMFHVEQSLSDPDAGILVGRGGA